MDQMREIGSHGWTNEGMCYRWLRSNVPAWKFCGLLAACSDDDFLEVAPTLLPKLFMRLGQVPSGSSSKP